MRGPRGRARRRRRRRPGTPGGVHTDEPFCPQTNTLTVGSFRAWNGLAERHEYDLVRARAAPMHHQSRGINLRLEALERRYLETGEVPDAAESGAVDPESADADAVGDGAPGSARDPPP